MSTRDVGMILMLSSRRPVPVIHGGSRRTYDLLSRCWQTRHGPVFSCWAGFNDRFLVAIILIDGKTPYTNMTEGRKITRLLVNNVNC